MFYIMTPQEASIMKTSGPCVILAGAGTGKSYTVVKKIGHMVSSGEVESEEILCLTFSNEATNSLKKKIQEELQNDADVEVKTFHAFCSDILKKDGHLIGIDEGFSLLLPDDAKIMMHKYLDIAAYWSGRYIDVFSTAKDFGIEIDNIEKHALGLKSELRDFAGDVDLDKFVKEKRLELGTVYLMPSENIEERKEMRLRKKELKEFIEKYDEYSKFCSFTQAWEKYEEFKKKKNYLDFSDLNDLVLKLFREFGADKYVEKFGYVFVDEFQDTNKLQFELIERIARHRNITVVGDPNQAIYGFRGSYKESFEHFKKVFGVDEGSDVFRLEKCYRSPNSVLNVSHDLIKNNYDNEGDCLHVQNAFDEKGEKVKVVDTVNAEEEARYIADLIEARTREGVSKNEICVLYRNHQQAEIVKDALMAKKIPVISAGRTDLLQTPEIRTVISHLGILSNLIERSGTGEQSWWSLFHYQNNLSPEDSVKIGRFVKKANRGNDGKRLEGVEEKGIDEILLNSFYRAHLSDEGKRTVERVVKKLRKLIKSSRKSLPELVLDVYDLSGLNRKFTGERSARNIEALGNLKKFHETVKNYSDVHDKTLTGFLHYLEVVDNVGVKIDSAKAENVDAVRMMTIHSSKGLEFDVVIVCNMASDRFPATRVRSESLIPKYLLPDFKAELESWGDLSSKEMEKRTKEYDKDILMYEERRLCYVAWTRAKKELVLTYSRNYRGEKDSNQASIFLNEIDFRNHGDCDFIEDIDELSLGSAPSSPAEILKSKLKGQIVEALDADDFDSVLQKVADYVSVRDGKVVSLDNVLLSKNEMKLMIDRCSQEKELAKFDRESFSFSPSSIMDYQECAKRFELKYIYRMSERGFMDSIDEGGGGAKLGSFVHLVLEEGVKEMFGNEREFLDRAEKLNNEDEWKGIDLDVAKGLIGVFWKRNRGRYNEKSECEMELIVSIGGYNFFGLADRVDYFDDESANIIDYKTNKDAISPKKRMIQLGFYAIALGKMGKKVSRLTLEMLKLDKPVIMNVDLEGNVVGDRKPSNFSLDEVKAELIKTCGDIERDYGEGFDVAEKKSVCRFCKFKFYCPKWEEK